jgi:2-polyprenyl-3-methyl-5-hydroxy-6-metoxy-1,4-benzoquinol methylase
MQGLAPDRLKDLWQSVEAGQLAWQEFEAAQERMLQEYRDIWKEALLLEGQPKLEDSLLEELCVYFGEADVAQIRRRCLEAVTTIRDQWQDKVVADDGVSVESFYDESEAYIYDLMWWHTLRDDSSPLAYVLALDFARRHGCRNCMDFGAGVGSGAILFARHGMTMTMADVSSSLIEFSEWRFRLRDLPSNILDTKVDDLPDNSFDMVTTIGTFEHLVDPVKAIERIWASLKPGGFLAGQFHAEPDDDFPQHIVNDFRPIFERMKSLGLVEVWRDEWLWGVVVLQKSGSYPDRPR